jgi:hypothetical protein
MTGWQTCRNVNPRQPWDLERLARHHAAKLGYRVHRSRRRKGPDNAGGLMLIHKASSTVLLGAGYTASVEMILSSWNGSECIQVPHRATDKFKSGHEGLYQADHDSRVPPCASWQTPARLSPALAGRTLMRYSYVLIQDTLARKLGQVGVMTIPFRS